VTLSRLSGLLEHDGMVPLLLRSPRTRMAATAMFDIARSHGAHLREAWRKVVACLLRLHDSGLLPDTLIPADSAADRDMLGGDTVAAAAAAAAPSAPAAGGSWPSLFSTVGQYLSLVPEAPARPDPAELERARAAVSELRIDDLLAETGFLPTGALQFLVKAIVHASAGEPGEAAAGHAPRRLAETERGELCLDLLFTVAMCNRDRLRSVWELFHDHLARTLAGGGRLALRAVLGVVRLCVRMPPDAPLLAEALCLLLRLPSAASAAVAGPLSRGLRLVLQGPARGCTAPAAWHAVFSLLESAAQQPAAMVSALDTLALALHEAPLNDDTTASAAAALLAFLPRGEAAPRVLELMYFAAMRTAQQGDWAAGGGTGSPRFYPVVPVS
jgi:brefeldin A-resistance guanine nucleotide exchange factor 1